MKLRNIEECVPDLQKETNFKIVRKKKKIFFILKINFYNLKLKLVEKKSGKFKTYELSAENEEFRNIWVEQINKIISKIIEDESQTIEIVKNKLLK